MDLMFTEQQNMIREAAREFFSGECSAALLRAIDADPRGYSPELWRALAGLGWLGLAQPESCGGSGLGFVELCILLEEQGRVPLPSPFVATAVLAALPIGRFGSPAQQQEYLPAVAEGRSILTYAEAEPGRYWNPAAVGLTATRRGASYVLNGCKEFVPYAEVADHLLVLTRTGGEEPDRNGLTLFLIDANATGIGCERASGRELERQCRLHFDAVPVSGEAILGAEGEAWPIVQAINDWGAAARCAEMAGGAQRVLEMSSDYARDRKAFGRPIGSFQAIQHHCANMAMDALTARLAAYEAIWRLSEELDAETEVATAKAWVSDAYQRVCALGHQIHGAIGFTAEHDMRFFYAHAAALEMAFGDSAYHRGQLATQLGL